jgi:anaerobic ribonucleoside-triphosphate reductase activating protein
VRLRVHRVLDRTAAEGPGVRACVWVQGCSIHCPGCFNTHMWDAASGHEIDPVQLGRRLGAVPGIEGLTLLGGEPFDQAAAVAALACAVRDAGRSTMVFTGHRLEALRASGDAGVAALLAATDLLVDGPYVAGLPDRHRPWVGSTNQRFHFLTDRYRGLELEAIPDRVEVRLRRDGTIWLNGQAPGRTLARLRRELAR